MPTHAFAAGRRRERTSPSRAGPRPNICRGAVLLATLVFLAFARAGALAAIPQGVWLIDGKAAVQIFDCGGLLCGRILRLQTPRDAQDRLSRDRHNPDPALRQRRLCSLVGSSPGMKLSSRP